MLNGQAHDGKGNKNMISPESSSKKLIVGQWPRWYIYIPKILNNANHRYSRYYFYKQHTHYFYFLRYWEILCLSYTYPDSYPKFKENKQISIFVSHRRIKNEGNKQPFS